MLKRKVITLVIMFIFLTLCACQKNETSNEQPNLDVNENETSNEQLDFEIDERTISDLITDEKYFILYDVHPDEDILAKDDEVKCIYILGNNEISCYNMVNDDETIGKFSKMTDDEIINYVKENGENAITINDEGKITDYAIALYTDSTGNNVESESICYVNEYQIEGEDDTSLYSLDFYNIPAVYARIYDSNYKGLADDLEYYDYDLWYRDNNNNILLNLDNVSLQGENVFLDSGDSDLYEYFSLEY